MAGVGWDELCDVTQGAVEDVLDALGPLSRELGLAAGLENAAAPVRSMRSSRRSPTLCFQPGMAAM